MKRVYLDFAAAAPATPRAVRAFLYALSRVGNPGAPHTEGREARILLEKARETIARIVGTKTDGVVFTSGATESNNLAICGVVEDKKRKGVSYTDMHLLYQEGAHASIVETMKEMEQRGVVVATIPLQDGALSLKALEQKLQKNTVLVSVESIASETGMRTHTRDVRRVLDTNAPHALLHVDASQTPLVESVERTHLGADLLVLDAQKIGGVRGIGVLVRAPKVSLSPVLFGGGQEGGLRSGTPTVALAHAFATALTDAESIREKFIAQATRARTLLKNLLINETANIVANEGKENAPHILNISFIGRDTDYLLALMDASGYALSTKSSCETDETGSRGVSALTNDALRASSTIRISWGPEVSLGTLKRFANKLNRAVAFIDSHSL